MALSESVTQQIASHISQVTAQPFQIKAQRSVGGGCINQAMQLSDDDRTVFVKLNQSNQLAMFEAERDGLQEMVVHGAKRLVSMRLKDGVVWILWNGIETMAALCSCSDQDFEVIVVEERKLLGRS